MRRITPISEVFLGRSMSTSTISGYNQQVISLQCLTIYICRIIQIDSENPAIRKCQNQNIVCDLRCDEVGGYGELKLDFLDIEYGKCNLIEVL